MRQTFTLHLRLLYLCMCIYNIHVGSKYLLSGSFSAALSSAGIISKVSRDNNSQSNNNTPDYTCWQCLQGKALKLSFAPVFAPCPLLPADCSVWHRFICKDVKSAGSHCVCTTRSPHSCWGFVARIAGVPGMGFCVMLGQNQVSPETQVPELASKLRNFHGPVQNHPREQYRWHNQPWIIQTHLPCSGENSAFPVRWTSTRILPKYGFTKVGLWVCYLVGNATRAGHLQCTQHDTGYKYRDPGH